MKYNSINCKMSSNQSSFVAKNYHQTIVLHDCIRYVMGFLSAWSVLALVFIAQIGYFSKIKIEDNQDPTSIKL